jgi:hypothetical protein
MSDYFRKGDLVTVTIRNFKVMEDDSLWGIHSGIEYSNRSGKSTDEIYLSQYNRDISAVKGSLASATAFRPKVGDIYKADGKIWYVRKYNGYIGTIVIEDGEGNSYSDDSYNLSNELERFERKMPKLLVRDGKEV